MCTSSNVFVPGTILLIRKIPLNCYSSSNLSLRSRCVPKALASPPKATEHRNSSPPRVNRDQPRHRRYLDSGTRTKSLQEMVVSSSISRGTCKETREVFISGIQGPMFCLFGNQQYLEFLARRSPDILCCLNQQEKAGSIPDDGWPQTTGELLGPAAERTPPRTSIPRPVRYIYS